MTFTSSDLIYKIFQGNLIIRITESLYSKKPVSQGCNFAAEESKFVWIFTFLIQIKKKTTVALAMDM